MEFDSILFQNLNVHMFPKAETATHLQLHVHEKTQVQFKIISEATSVRSVSLTSAHLGSILNFAEQAS